VAGGKMKSVSPLWVSPNTGATNSSGFTGLPGGDRNSNGTFNLIGYAGYWWSSSQSSSIYAWNRVMYYTNANLPRDYYNKADGFSVRCVKDVMPTVTTSAVSGINSTSAISGGNVIDVGGDSVIVKGVCWSTTPNPTVALSTKTNNGTGSGSFTSNVTGLQSNTTYYVRAYASNGVGTAYGNEISFTTLNLPTVTTTAITAIAGTTANSGGNVSSDGGSAVTARGVCWSNVPGPTVALATKTNNGSGTGSFTSNISGLNTNTTYYLRAYATNGVGTAYGNEISFTTLNLLTDIDGNAYDIVVIGTQVWMSKNLRVSKYRNGDPIPTNLNNTDWSNTTSGAYAIYNNDPVNDSIYGKLYNWYSLADPRGLCPVSWHVPSDAEWSILENFLGASSAAGGQMKSVSPLWLSPNADATNNSGFTGFPGGNRDFNGLYDAIGSFGFWWSSTQYSSSNSYWYRSLYYSNGNVGRAYLNKRRGLSVRCVRD
jgi:uncharacterized protein (TIGR02145 family)